MIKSDYHFKAIELFMFPDVKNSTPEGLIAVGGDLSPERLLMAYSRGIFPWYSAEDPILWWCPDPRAIIPLDNLHIGKTLRKLLKRNTFEIRIDTAFEEVIKGCRIRPKESGLGWITKDMIEAYTILHRLGHAHSVEAWRNEKLIGGLYGVVIGGLFAGESMFHREPYSSKAALIALVDHLNKRGFTLLDCQMVTETTKSMGAIEIKRSDYLRRLEFALTQSCSFQ